MTQKRIGLLIGREWSWPSAIMAEVNRRSSRVTAELVKLSGVKTNDVLGYDVIVDRMSHEIPFYRAVVKYAAMQGCVVLNDPYTWSIDDKFYGLSLVAQLGMKIPRTLILPNKTVEADTVPESFRNLSYPLDWEGVIGYVGVPAIFKDAITGGRRISYRVHNVDELIDRYDQSHTLTMILQEIVPAEKHIHCFVIGGDNVLPLEFSLEKKTYQIETPGLDADLLARIRADASTITRAFGYDINMVEFALADGTPYVINPTNPSPAMDVNLMGAAAFHWCVEQSAALAIDCALNPRPRATRPPWRVKVDG
ncbi:MAG: hypothetical protein KC418_17245 [Anaerolineales bacterium]|nr:hypothetical protein [Anaerolineales bacterium]MCB8951575.1 hypothetical protein [Ardenticatenales bacterium]